MAKMSRTAKTAKGQASSQGFENLKKAIRSKRLGNLYFFYGEEVFLLQHYLGQMRRLLLEELTEDFNYHRFTTESFTVQGFADAVENMPMMAPATMVQVDDISLFKLAEPEREKMVEVLSDIPPYCTVVFTYETTPWEPDKRMKKLWSAIEQNGEIVEFCKQDPDRLIEWADRHFAAHNKRISREVCRYFISISDGTMTSLNSDIEKLCAYSGADEIKRSDIDAVIEPTLDAVVFQITDMLGAGNYGGAILKLQDLLKMQEEPLSILKVIGNHFRRLGTARVLLDNGKNAGDLQRLCGLTDYRARKTMDAAHRISPALCRRASELVLDTDYKMKTSFDDSKRLLEILVLRLAQEAANG